MSERVTFRALARAHLVTLHAWIQRPHVGVWWGEPRSLEDIERSYLPGIEGTCGTRSYIACLAGEPIGFIQAYVVKGGGDGWWEDETDPGARGIDQFLADADRLDRGLGTCMVRAFVEQLFEDPAVTRVQTDPSPENRRAIACCGKAGFVPVGHVITPDGPALLMRCERSDLEGRRRTAV